MDNKSSIRFWFFWITVFITGLSLLVIGISSADEGWRTLLICITVIWFILGILLVQGMAEPKKRSILEADAKVIAKTSEIDVIITSSLFYVSFEFPDGTRENFSVKVDQYNNVVEGETGTLTYEKRKYYLKFIDFKPIK